MLSRWAFELETMEGQQPSIHWGPMLHGAFMKLWQSKTVEYLHESHMHPFAQYVEPRFDGRAVWHVHLFGEIFREAEEVLSCLTELHLTKRACVAIRNAQVDNISEIAFMEKVRQSTHRECTIQFITPCTHKSQGEYLKFPSLPLMFRSLHLRATGIFPKLYESEDCSGAIAEATRVQRYSLETAPFYVKETGIVGFRGFIYLKLPGVEKLLRTANVLIELAKYTGIGAKTSIGMGGVDVFWGE